LFGIFFVSLLDALRELMKFDNFAWRGDEFIAKKFTAPDNKSSNFDSAVALIGS